MDSETKEVEPDFNEWARKKGYMTLYEIMNLTSTSKKVAIGAIGVLGLKFEFVRSSLKREKLVRGYRFSSKDVLRFKEAEREYLDRIRLKKRTVDNKPKFGKGLDKRYLEMREYWTIVDRIHLERSGSEQLFYMTIPNSSLEKSFDSNEHDEDGLALVEEDVTGFVNYREYREKLEAVRTSTKPLELNGSGKIQFTRLNDENDPLLEITFFDSEDPRNKYCTRKKLSEIVSSTPKRIDPSRY